MLGLPVSAGALRKLLLEIARSGPVEDLAGADPGKRGAGDGRGREHVVAGDRERAAGITDIDDGTQKGHVAVGVPDDTTIPYVLATDVVRVGSGQAFPLEEIAQAVAARLGEHGAPLAARVPLLRTAVSEQLVASFARKNGVLAAVPWLRGADLPVLALNQLRLVLRLAQAYGAADDPPERLPELAAIVGAGFGLRAFARELYGLSPGAGWALRAAIAYSGTRAVGEAARLRFALASTPRPAGAARAAP